MATRRIEPSDAAAARTGVGDQDEPDLPQRRRQVGRERRVAGDPDVLGASSQEEGEREAREPSDGRAAAASIAAASATCRGVAPTSRIAANRRSRIVAPMRVLAATKTPIGIRTPRAARR